MPRFVDATGQDAEPTEITGPHPFFGWDTNTAAIPEFEPPLDRDLLDWIYHKGNELAFEVDWMPTRKGPDFVFAAKYRTQCPICKEYIYPDDKVLFPDRESKYVVHEACYGKLPTPASNPSPPASMSPGQVGPKPEQPPAVITPAAVPAQEDTFMVLVGAYVWSDKADLVVKAIREARKWSS
jgi:hypothetical protein